jgi:hypothetical protein
MATYEEPLPAWLEQEMKEQGLTQPPKPKPPKREMSKPAYERGEECPY